MSEATKLSDLAVRVNDYSGPNIQASLTTLHGFEVAQRIAKALMSSDAVPSIFRRSIEKRGKNGSTWIDNPSAMGNCLVVISVATMVGMDPIAVMQNANIIEGKLSWSAKFQIAAVNASRRFSPLKFRMTQRGRIKAEYREKGEWNEKKRGFDFITKTVEFDDIECVAWAYEIHNGQVTNEIVEGPPVSIKMAVEEGWFSKPGSKWQTEMKHLMLHYRAGAYFANLHAPDVVMGMGRSTEEQVDTLDAVADENGNVSVPVSELRKQTPRAAKRDTSNAEDAKPAQETANPEQNDSKPDQKAADVERQASTMERAAEDANQQADEDGEITMDPDVLIDQMSEAKSLTELQDLYQFSNGMSEEDFERVTAQYDAFMESLNPATQKPPVTQEKQTRTPRTRRPPAE